MKNIFIQVLRHGERTPQDTYEYDPYKNDPMEPYGWGQLTNASILRLTSDVTNYI